MEWCSAVTMWQVSQLADSAGADRRTFLCHDTNRPAIHRLKEQLQASRASAAHKAIQRPAIDGDPPLIFRAVMFKATVFSPEGQRLSLLEVRKRNQGYSFPASPAVAEGLKVWRSKAEPAQNDDGDHL